MSKHKALDMFGRSGNPTLSDATFADFENVNQKTMTLQGTVNKVGILLALVVLSAAYTWNVYFVTGSPGALMPIGLFGGMIFALITIFKKLGDVHCTHLCHIRRSLLGGISAIFESQYPGIVIQATGLTFGTLASLLCFIKQEL